MRIFDYLNISNERSIWADSGFHVQKSVIKEILKKRNDYHFYLTVPYERLGDVKQIESDRLTLMPYHYSGGSGHKYHFDTNELWDLMDMWHKDWDLVLCNEVILGTHFKNMFCYKSHFDIPIVNYIHWVNTTADITPQQWDMFTSIYWCHRTYCNSEYGKHLVTKELDGIFKESTSNVIKNRLGVLNVGFDEEELDRYRTKDKFDKVTLVFNHRISQYTGYDKLLQKCKQIYDGGFKDFQLIFTNPSVSLTRVNLTKYPFLKVCDEVLSRQDYIRLLWKSDICFGLHSGQNQWSIAFLEALYCNNIPITTNGIFFNEMLSSKTNTLDDLEYVMQHVSSIKKNYNLKKYYWKYLATGYIKAFEEAVESYEKSADWLKKPNESKVLQQVLSIFETKPIVEKREILSIRAKMTGSGIGAQTPITKYRRELLKNHCDDMIEKKTSFYKLKDMKKAKVKPVDYWLKEY